MVNYSSWLLLVTCIRRQARRMNAIDGAGFITFFGSYHRVSGYSKS